MALDSLVEDISRGNPTAMAQECSLASHWDSRKFGSLVAGCFGDQQGLCCIQPRVEIGAQIIRPIARCMLIPVEIGVTVCPRVSDQFIEAMLLQQVNKLIDL